MHSRSRLMFVLLSVIFESKCQFPEALTT